MDIKQKFIEVLEKDITHWEDAANICDALVGAVFGKDEKERMDLTAQTYRARAKAHAELLESVKEST